MFIFCLIVHKVIEVFYDNVMFVFTIEELHARARTFGNHVTIHRPSAPQRHQCLISHFQASLGAQEQPDIALILHKNVVIN